MGLYLEDLDSSDNHISIFNCKSCPLGTFSNQEGQGSLDACRLCPAGWFNKFESNWKKGDKYQTNDNPVEEGSEYQHKHINCTECNVGQYQSSEGQSACLECLEGTYLDEKGRALKDDCKSCERGRYSGTKGNTMLRDCKQCPTGRFGNETKQINDTSACHYCGAGEHVGRNDTDGVMKKSRRRGETGCAPCDVGYFLSPQLRALNPKMFCLKCDGAAETGMQECHGCAQGKFGFISPNELQTNCTECKSFGSRAIAFVTFTRALHFCHSLTQTTQSPFTIQYKK
jgi:hypothetical protein